MKNTLNLLAGGLVFGTMLIWQSCGDPCKDVTCQNGGTPTEDGKDCKCNCASGYEGTVCDKKTQDKFLGSWICNPCSTLEIFTITASSDPSKIIIESDMKWFDCDSNDTFDEPVKVICLIGSDGTSFTFDASTVQPCNNTITQNASGSKSGSALTLNYTYTKAGQSAVSYNYTLYKY